MKYYNEVRKLVNSYKRIAEDMKLLDAQAKLLTLNKNQIELELSQTREAEKALIDKIKKETGGNPDFYKILHSAKDETISVD